MSRQARPPAVRTPPPRRPAPPADGPLRASVRAAVAAHPADPTAVLALGYAGLIDDATHVPASLVKTVGTLRAFIEAADAPATVIHALHDLVMRVSTQTVTSDLGPKLVAALDALVLTPKSQGAGAPASKPANPLDKLRAEEDELTRKRRERRNRPA